MPDVTRAAQLEAVIFDMDDVVTRPARLHARAWKQLFDVLHEQGAEVFDTTVERIRELRARGVRTGLVTSRKHGREVIRLARLTDLFDVIVDGSTAQERALKGKPNPDIFPEAARAVGVGPVAAAVVEDAVSGVQAGARGGFASVIGVNRGSSREALERAGADVVVDDLAELSVEELLTPRSRVESTRGGAR